jgi:Ca2+-binding RTX toxin-like protein
MGIKFNKTTSEAFGTNDNDEIRSYYISELDEYLEKPGDYYKTIYGRGGDDIIEGWNGSEHLYGQDGDDYVKGGLGSDFISGGAGDDYLIGYKRVEAKPTLNPETSLRYIIQDDYGQDTLYGGAGADTMDGGGGNDTYYVDQWH